MMIFKKGTVIALLLCAGTLILAAKLAAQTSDPFAKDVCAGIPLCEAQAKAPLKFHAWEITGWAFYCTGDHPYYWPFGNFTIDNGCIGSSLEGYDPNQPSKLDANFNNKCLKSETFTLTMGCSAQPYQTCTPVKGIFKDPKCPVQVPIKTTCSRGALPVCIETWSEECPGGDVYWCTADIGAVACTLCAGGQ